MLISVNKNIKSKRKTQKLGLDQSSILSLIYKRRKKLKKDLKRLPIFNSFLNVLKRTIFLNTLKFFKTQLFSIKPIYNNLKQARDQIKVICSQALKAFK